MFGKYKDPEPLYDPIKHKQLYSDHHIRFDHDLEKYQINKETEKGKCFQTYVLIFWWLRNNISQLEYWDKFIFICTDQTTTLNNDERYSRGARIKRRVVSTNNQKGKLIYIRLEK